MESKIIGQVQNIRKDKKAIQIKNEWFSGFNILDYKKGEELEITYFVNEKGFNQIKDIKFLPISHNELKSDKKPNEIIASQLTSYTKDILNKLIESNLITTKEDFIRYSELISNNLIEQFNKFKVKL